MVHDYNFCCDCYGSIDDRGTAWSEIIMRLLMSLTAASIMVFVMIVLTVVSLI